MKRNWFKHVVPLLLVFSFLLSPLSASPVYALSATNLVAPADGMTTTVTTNPPLGIPEFKWATVSGATTYRLQVSNNIGFSGTLAVNITTPNTVYTHNLSSSFSDGTWYWRVRVETPTPVSEYSSIWSFTKQWATPENAPALNSPDDNSIIDFYEQPVFSWGTVTGAAKYRLQIYTSPGGWSSTVSTNDTLTTTFQPLNKLANGIYYWRILPLDTAGHAGTPSEERSFTVSYNYIPLLLEPADNATPTFTPTLRWTAVRGAQFYRLQYGTDPTFATYEKEVDTRNTTYTPIAALPNDVNYYWRVRVHSGTSISSWTSSRTFVKHWYIQPVLLTPVNSYQHVRFPIFSWTPVPGAATYKVELDTDINFASPIFDTGITANTFYSPSKYLGGTMTYYWRVTPIDGSGKNGLVSNTSSYQSYSTSLAPHQVYPLYYYPPNTYPGFPGVTINPHEDRSVPLPTFIWHRVLIGAGDPNAGQVYASAYRIQVSTDATFTTVNWTVVTENTVAAPTSSNSFTPTPNIDYYWRVRPVIGGVDAGQWSQIWKTRFDPTRGLTPNNLNPGPALIRPTNGFEFAESTPLLEWFPLTGASSYDVQISRDEAFSAIVDSATVSYPAYAPTQSLAQRNLGDIDFGVYYWRVKNSDTGIWSETRRFQIAAQSQWKNTRTLGDSANRLQIGSDPASDASADYDLTTLQVSQSSSNWYFGFNVPNTPTQNVTYGLYLDLDHLGISGATFDARNYSVSTIPAFKPEYAIYILQEGGTYAASKVYLYRWNGIDWGTPNVLSDIGGQIIQNGTYVELSFPNTSIGYQDTTGSYAVSLFSLPAAGGQPQDSVPSDPAIPGPGTISRFANVTERMNLVAPPTNAGIDPTTYPSILPFFWDYPILAPYSGAIMKSYLDPAFTTLVDTYTLTSDTAYYAQTSHAWLDDFNGDNTYYWRVQPRYRDGLCVLCLGVWSQGWRFERQGFVPQNLQTSVTFATPTFSWDMVEGAEYYDLQVDNDPAFGTPVININTRQNSYTDTDTLGNAIYYWRVRIHRDGSIINDWSTVQSFTLELPIPTGLNNIPSGVVGRAPTLCWDTLIKNSPLGEPVLAAYKYRVQVSKDTSFSTIFDTADTEQSCWTPETGYDDGTYYWRVAMIDGKSKIGNYSAYATVTKQYPVTTLVSPTSGSALGGTPTFIWTPVYGAASYKLEVSQSPTFSPVYDSITTDNTRWTPKKTYASLKTYYWRIAIVDDNSKVGPWVGATIILTDFIPINIYIGAPTSPIGSYGLAVGSSMRQNYAGLSDGPVKVTSPDKSLFFTSERASSGGNSFNEVMGYPANQFTTEYWFPWYDNIDMATWLLVGNPSTTSTAAVDIYIGGLKKGSYAIAKGKSVTPRFPLQTGPVRVVSTNGVPIFTSERSLYGINNSFNEVMGYPANQFTTEYWFPFYDNSSMTTWVLVGNPTSSTAKVDIYVGTAKTSFAIGAGKQITPRFDVTPTGPVRVVSTNGVKIFTSERVLYGDSFNEVMGYPTSQLTTEYWFPWYDNISMSTWLLVGNPTGSTANVDVYIGKTKYSYSILAGKQINQRYSFNTGPVRVVSTNGVKVFTSERVLYGPSFNEVMGYPGNKLTYEYWFPWYDNSSMDTDIVVGNK